MTTNPEEHDFIQQVCAEDDAGRVPPRLSDDPLVRLEECRSALNFDQYRMESAIAGCRIVMPDLKKSEFKPFMLGAKAALDAVEKYRSETPFDEVAERAKFEAAFPVAQGSPIHVHLGNKLRYEGWLACARARHNESTKQGEE